MIIISIFCQVEEAHLDQLKANEEIEKAKEQEIEKERLYELKKQEQLRILKVCIIVY